jgi:hypothetical protein
MRTTFHSRTTPKVKNGRVQPKNRNRLTSHSSCVIDRESPGHGFQHVVTKADLQAFLDIIPDWERYSERLERIVLAAPGDHCDGLYEFFHREESGVIYLHAWSKDLWVEMVPSYFQAHQTIFDRLGVRYDIGKDYACCYFSAAQARAYILLHVFLHELGHHFDRIHQKHLGATKGEDYAEQFANSRFELLLPRYEQVFGPPQTSR